MQPEGRQQEIEKSFGLQGTHFRGHKICGVARGHEKAILCSQLLGEAEVADANVFRVSRLIHVEDVAGFQVPVNYLQRKKQKVPLQHLSPIATTVILPAQRPHRLAPRLKSTLTRCTATFMETAALGQPASHQAEREQARLSASPTHPLRVQILHRFTDRMEDRTGLPLREALLPEDFVQQLPSSH